MNKTCILDEATLQRTPPANISQEDYRLFSKEFNKTFPSVYLEEVQDAIMTPEGVFVRRGKVNKRLTQYSKAKHPSHFLSKDYLKFIKKNYWDRSSITISKQALWIIDKVSHNYFHWLFDVLPRLWVFQKNIVDHQNYTLLLPENYQNLSFVQEALTAFGISDITYLSDKATYRVDSLLIIEHTAPTGNYRPDIVQEVRKRLLAKLEDQSFSKESKIYASRGKAPRRKILNEEELIKVLDRHQFSTVYFEELSFRDQINIIKDAKYLVSNHGAGLSNMLFMQPGSYVFELRQENDTHNNCYFSLASANSLNYYYQTCPPDKSKIVNAHSDIYVNISEFEKNLSIMLADE
ncbi:glycosyltransferase family 61 protein [Tunicatimonas pelagia]|uniref:glycosyltransferase family 61 protein n=1 Tax=Tunicatimonas pelagia TaxID=931531 RepID=UPI002665F06A|nr:glycosyltransferase family 61 protein [Tunicatimonas pelagia]WKN40716.1 glycosyltransferase family 61 protein [Tunicatimonas pelagia]